MIAFAIPGAGMLRLTTAIVDFNGTLTCDGRLKAGVAGRLRQLAKRITICVVTGDTTGTARESVAGLPLSLEIVAGERQAEAKLEFASQFKREAIVAIGNGRNAEPSGGSTCSNG